MKSFVKKIISAPSYVLNFPMFNRAGLQRFRINSKKVSDSKQLTLSDSRLILAYKELNDNGIALIPDFFSEASFNELLQDIEKMSTEELLTFEIGKEGGDVHWLHGNFPLNFSQVVESNLRQNQNLLQIVEGYTSRKLYSFAEVIFQNLTMPKGSIDNEDVQTVLHADRHYRTLKMFYTVSDHTEKNGAFWYCPKSHIMTDERIKYEVDYSVRASLQKTGSAQKLDTAYLEKGRSIIDTKLLEKYELKQMKALKNTLIIVDVSGFHKRGLIMGGDTRKTIRLIYHYVHAPIFIQKIFKIFGREPGRYLN